MSAKVCKVPPAIVGGLKDRDPFGPVLGIPSRDNGRVSSTMLIATSVKVPANARHLPVVHGMTGSQKSRGASLANVRKQDVTAAQVLVSVELLTHGTERHKIQPFGLFAMLLVRRVLRDRERVHREGEKVAGELGVEDEKGLTRNSECQFHARKHHDTILLDYGLAGAVDFTFRRSTDEWHKSHVVVVGNRHRM
ncbi:MAG TPA: hypothetical protein VL282_10185 [Tepidisphaeraceae bacterium]|nr:hypothetical protein [Tepidisphaeraceae bacterium]